ncbi:MAG: long-chain fatty acid--CoA ligase, partial [Actinomycetota bacterium]|nr:long-chain fatty acid--CoA ligase [Actinomycetota bacterium]
HDRCRRSEAALRELGVGVGTRVALLVGNVPEFVTAMFGAHLAGAAVSPLNVMLTPEELGYILADAEATVVVAQARYVPAVLAVRDRVATLRHVLVVGPGPHPPGTMPFDDRSGEPAVGPPPEVGEDGLAVIAYTAGTTAAPKGAMLSHGNLLANLEQISAVAALREAEDDVVLLALPLFHIYGLNAVLGVVLSEGATAVLVERFDPARTLELVRRHGVTVLFGAPPMFGAWLDAAGGADLSPVRLAVSGAAPLPGRLLEAFRDRFGVTIWEGYGLTETAPVVTTNALGPEARPGSIGLPLPGLEVRLADEDGDDVEEGDPGEILVRGANVFRGYWRKPDVSEAVFRGDWFRTGDVAYRDEDGYLFLVDRKKDLIIVSGFNVYPKEVEDALVAHPGVAECAVVGVPDERTGEAVKAFVVPAEGAAVTEAGLVDHCRAVLARFKCPREVELVDELPRHPTGKVLRRSLRP